MGSDLNSKISTFMSKNPAVFLGVSFFTVFGVIYLGSNWNSEFVSRVRGSIKNSWKNFWTPRKMAGIILSLVVACTITIWILSFKRKSLKFRFWNTSMHWYPTIYLDFVASCLTLFANFKVNYDPHMDLWMYITLFIASAITIVKAGHIMLTIIGKFSPDLTNFANVVCAGIAALIPYLKATFDIEAKEIDDSASATRTVLKARRALPRIAAARRQAEEILNKVDHSKKDLANPAVTSFDCWVAINVLRREADAHRIIDALGHEQRIVETVGFIQIIKDRETDAKSILDCEKSVKAIDKFHKELYKRL